MPRTLKAERINRLEQLLARVLPVPSEWTGVAAKQADGKARGPIELSSLTCQSWDELVLVWRKALQWRQELEDVLAVMLAVAISTDQAGENQLFLQVLGPAGSAKSRFCDAMLVSHKCMALEHLTGFFSGWKGKGEGEDYSFIARCNKKTLITSEGDVIKSSPKVLELMSQQRRIFDGVAGASYKNNMEDRRYTGLRTPWIMAGTPALLNMDQSKLGDRFLRIFITVPDEDQMGLILRRVAFSSMNSVLQPADGRPDGVLDEKMTLAYRMTGGYVDWLRNNATELLSSVQLEREAIYEKIENMARFVAYMRARPETIRPYEDKELNTSKEQPTRLIGQFGRLAICLAAVRGDFSNSDSVLRIVKKVALDTARGRPFTICRHLYGAGELGLQLKTIVSLTGDSERRDMDLIRFMARPEIGLVEAFTANRDFMKSTVQYRLSDRAKQLYRRVVG